MNCKFVMTSTKFAHCKHKLKVYFRCYPLKFGVEFEALEFHTIESQGDRLLILVSSHVLQVQSLRASRGLGSGFTSSTPKFFPKSRSTNLSKYVEKIWPYIFYLGLPSAIFTIPVLPTNAAVRDCVTV